MAYVTANVTSNNIAYNKINKTTVRSKYELKTVILLYGAPIAD